MDEVWVALTWKAHGYEEDIHGVFDSREAAFESLKALPNMAVYVDEHGNVAGRPRKERDYTRPLRRGPYVPEYWASAAPYKVQGRTAPSPPGQPQEGSGSPASLTSPATPRTANRHTSA